MFFDWRRLLLLFPLVVVFVLFAWSTSDSPESSPGNREKTVSESQPDSHTRMLQTLEDIRRQNRTEQKTFGKLPVESKEIRLRALSPRDRQRRFELAMRIGNQRLWRGDTRRAIDHFLTAYNLLSEFRRPVPQDLWEETVYHVGLAYLRLGENENCVLCNNGESCLLPIRGDGIHTNQTGSRKAIEYFTQLLEQNPDHLSARWLLNLAYMTVGEYPGGVPSELLVPPTAFESEQEFPRFRNIATQLGIGAVNLSGGSIVDDFDNDGDLDIVTSSWGDGDQILYFRNNGDGTFRDGTQQAGLTGIFGGLNLVQADYDNDGDVDVLVLRGAWYGPDGRIPNSLLQNNGEAFFSDVTIDAGLADENYPTQTAAWTDYDNDGDLDLYVGNEQFPCQLFENNGEGVFTDVAERAGVQNNRYTKAVTCGDFNQDGFPDIYVSNLGDKNRLYVNDQNGAFVDAAPRLNLTGPQMSFPAWFWDFNNDGALDLFVSSYSYGVDNLMADYLRLPRQAERDHLYQGDGKGGFREVGHGQNLRRSTQPMGSNFGDLDNDGYPDFYLGTGIPAFDGLMPNLMFHNSRGNGFVDVTTAGGVGHLQKGHGVAFADIDNDGDQDIFCEMGGAYPGDTAANCLFQNPGFGNHSITLKLVGRQSNRSAIGARIKINISENGQARTIYKWVNSGGSFGANPLRQEIGLGKAQSIDRLEIYWPTSGLTQRFHNVPVNRFLEITEGKNEFRLLSWKKIRMPAEAAVARH